MIASEPDDYSIPLLRGRQQAEASPVPPATKAVNVMFTSTHLDKHICITFYILISTNVAVQMIITGGPLPLVCGQRTGTGPSLGFSNLVKLYRNVMCLDQNT